jgi:two-component system, sensor histidine kinase LadS
MKYLFSILLLLIFAFGNANAETPDTVWVSPITDASFISISKNSVIMNIGEDTVSFDEIKANNPELLPKFKKINDDVSNLDFTTSTYWVKFCLRNVTETNLSFYLETARPLTNTVTLYETVNSATRIFANGDDIIFNAREIKHRKAIFPINLNSGDIKTYYLKLQSDGEVITLPMKLWNIEKFHKKDYTENLLLGVFYGILIFVAIIYFFFYLAMKEKSFLYYVLYVISIFFLQFSLDGFSFQYLWPDNTWLSSHGVLLSACFTELFAVLYVIHFTKLKERLPKAYILLKVLVILTIGSIIAGLTSGKIYSYNYPFINSVSFASIIIILAIIGVLIKKKHNVSYMFALAFIFLLTGAAIFILGNFNLINNSFLTEHALKAGSTLEVIFLSLSMANRYREIQKEKEEAQAETLEKLKEMNKLKDEINIELEKQVKERTREINQQKEELAEKNKEITDSIRYAKRIQQAILPSGEYCSSVMGEHFILFLPKDIVSGDFYWLHNDGQKIIWAAADCTGHGVPGGFMSMIGNSYLNEIVIENKINSPDKILNTLRSKIINSLEQKGSEVKQRDGMDISLCVLDKENNVLEYSGANNPLWIWKKNTNIIEETKADKMPIGSYTEELKPFTLHRFNLEKGDIIYCFSDGYADQFGGPKGKKFKYSQLKEILLSVSDKTMTEQKEILHSAINNWKGNQEQIDDICIIGIRIT